MRKYHLLKGSKRCSYPIHCVFFDVESELIEDKDNNKIRHKPYLLIAKYVRMDKNKVYERQVFYKVEDFWYWLTQKIKHSEKYYIFAHNITYDMVTSKGFECLHKAGYEIKNFYENGLTFILTLIKDIEGKRHSTIEILNVANYYHSSVKEMGKVFNLPKMDYDVQNPNIEIAIPYCERDVDIIVKAMMEWFKFCKENKLGKFGRTLSSQAFNGFTQRFMTHKIYIHNNQKAIDIERLCYYGGRSECFAVGEFTGKNYYYLDVNSMYPYVMRENSFPTRLWTVLETLSLDKLAKTIEKYNVCCEAKIETNKPVFPVRYKKHLIFPIGCFTTHISTPELKFAIENNMLRSVKDVCIYERNPIFNDYVNFFYTKRLEAKSKGDSVNTLLYKYFLNTLYGKFGQFAGGWEKVGYTPLEGAGYIEIWDTDKNMEISRRWLFNTLFEKGELQESYNSFPAIAAHVTAYARMLLWEYIEIAGYENVYYSDTDSLFLNEEGYKNLKKQGHINEHELGKLKIEDISNNVVIYCPKDYIFGRMEKHKGVGKNDELIANNTWRQTIWPKLSTLIKQNSMTEYFNDVRDKTLERIYNKGYIIDKRVYPLELRGDEIVYRECDNLEKLREEYR